jgi:hypothetical protein
MEIFSMKLYLVTSVFLMMHSFSVYAACSFDTPAQCTTESECKFQKGTWANGICTDGSTPIPTTVNLAITPPTNGEIKCGDNADQTCPTKPTKDTPVKLTAKPSAGYQFKSWGVDCASQTTSVCSLTMSTDKTVSVTFEQISVTPTNVNLTITPPINGEIKCGDNADQSCSSQQTKDAIVRLTAKPSAGYQFKSWDSNSACAGQTTSVCSLTMSTDKTVSVVFEQIPVTPTNVNLTITPPTNGEIKCGDNADQTCPTKPTKDTPVKLTAKPSAGYQFKSWDSNSACAGQTTSVCSLTMSTDKTVSVVFEQIPVTPTNVNLTITPPTNGEIKCGDNADQSCSSQQTKDAIVRLTAKPSAGYQFKSWGDACASQTTSTCSLTMSTDKTVSVTFAIPVTQKVTLTVISPTNGRLLCDGVDCVNGKQYDSGTTVAIQGVAEANYSPSAWTNDALAVCTSNPCQFTLNGNKTIGATFVKKCAADEKLENGVCVKTTPPCTTAQTLVNSACISTDLMKLKLESPLAIRSDGNGNNIAPATTSVFFGGISVVSTNSDGSQNLSSPEKTLTVKKDQTISVNGLIVPQHQGVADIIVVGLYVPPENLTGQTASLNDCDPNKGDFYMNTASVDYADNYCNWVVDRFTGQIESTNICNNPDNRRAALSSNVMNFWNAWGGHLNTLKPMYSNVSLDSNGVSKLLYKDTVNYTGQVCLYFGYRLTDNEKIDKRTLVFNGEPIIFRATSSTSK